MGFRSLYPCGLEFLTGNFKKRVESHLSFTHERPLVFMGSHYSRTFLTQASERPSTKYVHTEGERGLGACVHIAHRMEGVRAAAYVCSFVKPNEIILI